MADRYIDTNGCEHSFHYFKKDDDERGMLRAYHNDDTICSEIEYSIMGEKE